MNRDDDIAAFERYLQRRFPGRRTPVDYVSDVRLFARQCAKPWRAVTLADIDQFVDQQRQAGRSPATVKRRVAGLKTFFDFLAEATGELDWPNPVRFKRHAGKQPRPLPRDLSEAELDRLWAVVDSTRDRAWLVLMWRAGLRVSEVARLTVADMLNPPQGDQPARLRVCGKGRKERVVLLSADAYAVLAAWLAARPASAGATIFVNARGQPLSVNGIEWQLRRYGRQAGVAVSPHRLRHTFARQVTEAGMPLASVGKLLGHADLNTTQRYTAGADPQLAQAYQQAMQQLAVSHPAVPRAPLPPPPPAAARPRAPAPTFERAAWDGWAPELPAAIRQACLDLVTHRWPGWKAQRRMRNARQSLGELRRFFTWQLAFRPVSAVHGLRRADLAAYQTDRLAAGLTPGTINATLDDVQALLKAAAEQGLPMEASLFRLRPLPRPESLPRHLTVAESQHLEATLGARLGAPDPGRRLELACWFVLAHSGLRAGECLDLLGGDLDLAGGRLIVRQGKGQKDRVVYLSATARRALSDYLAGQPRAPDAPLLQQPEGRRLTYAWLYAHIRRLAAEAGVGQVSPHRLRHTLATQLLNAGMDITRIQKLFGHDHLNTTLIYARLQDATLEADYRQAMQHIERQHMPLSSTAQPVANWPARSKVPVDNSV